jgi:hypothetical protein
MLGLALILDPRENVAGADCGAQGMGKSSSSSSERSSSVSFICFGSAGKWRWCAAGDPDAGEAAFDRADGGARLAGNLLSDTRRK